MSIFKVSPENRNLDYYLEMYNSKFVSNDSLQIIQLYYYLYENIDVYTDELYILEKHKPDLDGFCRQKNFNSCSSKDYYNHYLKNIGPTLLSKVEKNYNPVTLFENYPKIYIIKGFSSDIMRLRSIIWNDTQAYNKNNNYVEFDMLILAYKLKDIKHLLSPIKGITKL